MKGGKTNESNLTKFFLSKLVSKICYNVIGVPTHDTTNSFKAYRKEIFNRIKCKAKHFDISMEITIKAHKLGYKITEIPTIWTDRKQGQSKFSITKMGAKYYNTIIKCVFFKAKKK